MKEDSCPLSSAQATEILIQQKIANKELTDIKSDLVNLNTKVDNLYIQDAGRVGYVKGAGIWFKLGALVALVSIGAGMFSIVIAIASVLTGNKIDITSLFK